MIKDTGCGKVDVQVKGSWPTPAPDELKQLKRDIGWAIGHGSYLDEDAREKKLEEIISQILAYVDKRERLAHDTGFIAGKDATLDGLALTNSKVTEGE